MKKSVIGSVLVFIRVDYCNAILAGASKYITDKLQRVMIAAARVVSDSRKYDRGHTSQLHDKLHWLDIPEWVQYKLCAMVHRCMQHKAPQYMIDCCVYTSDIARRQHLRSASCSAACAATPPFNVRSSGLFCGRPNGLELVTRLPSRSDAFC